MENHNYENEGQFQRKMTSRHLFMLSLGGVIGTGLFLSSGYTIAQARSPWCDPLLPCGGCCRLLGYAFFGGVSSSYASNGVISYLRH